MSGPTTPKRTPWDYRSQGLAKVTVFLPTEVRAKVEQVAGARKVSQYIADLVEDSLRKEENRQ